MLVKVAQIFFLAVLLTVSSLGSIAHSQVINPQQIDFLLAGTIKANGQPNSQGKIYFWNNSSKTTAKTVWSDFGATTPLSNPVVLDARGASNVFAFGTYYCELYDKNDVLIKTYTSISYSYTPESENLFLDVGATYGRSQSDIDEALTDIGTTPKTMLFNAGTFNFTSNTIFPSNVGLFISDTASFNVSSGKTVTINGSLSYAPNRQIFFGAGSYDIDTDRNNIANGLWFGGSGVGIGTQTPAYSLDVVGTVNATTAVNSVVGAFSTKVTSPLGVFSTKGQFGSGSAASPSITETTVGISGLFFETGVGALGFSTLGTEKMRITSSGSVGIGSSTPLEKLYVVGNVRATTGLKLGTNIIIDAASNTFLNSDSSNPFVISTTSAQPIQMGVNSGLILELATTGTTFSGVAKFPSGSAAAPSIVNAAATTSGLFWSSTATGVSVAGSEKMRVNATGVGIGLTNPAYSLDVVGTVNATALQINNLNLNGNTISTTSGALNLTPITGQVIYQAGSAVTPSIVQTGATTTGLFWVGGATAISAVGSEKMRVNASGVGIATTTPAYPLDVSGTTRSSFFLGDGGFLTNLNGSQVNAGTVPSSVISGVYSEITGLGTLTALNVDNLNADLNTISTTSGSLNLTPLSGQNLNVTLGGVADLVVQGADFTGGTFTGAVFRDVSAERLRVGYYDGDPTTGLVPAQILVNASILSLSSRDVGGGTITFRTGTGIPERMRIDSAGRVGIGMTNPTETLHVSGNICVGTVTDIIYSNNIGQVSSVAPMTIYSNSETIFKNTSEVEFLRITGGGRVGIGTTTPTETLHVSGNAYISTSLQIGGTGTVRIAGAASGTGTALIIDASGDIRPQTSSRRFKKNIYETKLDYTDVLKFELKEFKYKNTDIFVPIGIMAEDTADINSGFVNFDKDGLPYSINQSVVLYSLLGVLKDLKDDNDFTLQTLDALIKKVAKLEAEIKYLRKVDSINANR